MMYIIYCCTWYHYIVVLISYIVVPGIYCCIDIIYCCTVIIYSITGIIYCCTWYLLLQLVLIAKIRLLETRRVFNIFIVVRMLTSGRY